MLSTAGQENRPAYRKLLWRGFCVCLLWAQVWYFTYLISFPRVISLYFLLLSEILAGSGHRFSVQPWGGTGVQEATREAAVGQGLCADTQGKGHMGRPGPLVPAPHPQVAAKVQGQRRAGTAGHRALLETQGLLRKRLRDSASRAPANSLHNHQKTQLSRQGGG